MVSRYTAAASQLCQTHAANAYTLCESRTRRCHCWSATRTKPRHRSRSSKMRSSIWSVERKKDGAVSPTASSWPRLERVSAAAHWLLQLSSNIAHVGRADARLRSWSIGNRDGPACEAPVDYTWASANDSGRPVAVVPVDASSWKCKSAESGKPSISNA